MPSMIDPKALACAIENRPGAAPSSRSKAITCPPASSTTTESGFSSSSLPFAKVPRIIDFAFLRLISGISILSIETRVIAGVSKSDMQTLLRLRGFQFQSPAVQDRFRIT